MRVRRTGSSRLRALNCSPLLCTRARTSPPGWGYYPPPAAIDDIEENRARLCRLCDDPPQRPRANRQRPLRQAEDRSRDDEPLNLARPLVDLGDPRVPVIPLDGKLLRVAVPTEDLDRLTS